MPITAADISEYLQTRSDFDLELFVCRALRERGYVTAHGGTYIDPAKGIPRQFDVRAHAMERKNLEGGAKGCQRCVDATAHARQHRLMKGSHAFKIEIVDIEVAPRLGESHILNVGELLNGEALPTYLLDPRRQSSNFRERIRTNL